MNFLAVVFWCLVVLKLAGLVAYSWPYIFMFLGLAALLNIIFAYFKE